MASPGKRIVQQLRQVVGGQSAQPRDADLLERFRAHNDADAFAGLVARHGPLVLGVCRRVLRHHHDAEDAFQATFLVLARRAGAVRRPASLAAWLHGVAFRLACKLRAGATQRRRLDLQAGTARAVTTQAVGPPDMADGELRPIVDEELQRLAEGQRLAVLLCCVEGLSQQEAAQQLGWPRGTLKRRLERGRALLRQRLARRGLALPAAVAAVQSVGLSAAVGQAAPLFAAGNSVPPALLDARVITLAEGVLRNMVTAKLKFALAMLAFVALGAWGAMLYGQSWRPAASADAAAAPQAPAASATDQDPAPQRSSPTGDHQPGSAKQADPVPPVRKSGPINEALRFKLQEIIKDVDGRPGDPLPEPALSLEQARKLAAVADSYVWEFQFEGWFIFCTDYFGEPWFWTRVICVKRGSDRVRSWKETW
jgi:RNA polymerase sigma-70 factor (ECF subfamily)